MAVNLWSAVSTWTLGTESSICNVCVCVVQNCDKGFITLCHDFKGRRLVLGNVEGIVAVKLWIALSTWT